jgi:histidyl-tRNA synthetase
VATLGPVAYEKALLVADLIRAAGIVCMIDHGAKSLKSQMRSADKMGAAFTIIIGDEEIEKGRAVLRDMSTKEQSSVKFEELASVLKERVGE